METTWNPYKNYIYTQYIYIFFFFDVFFPFVKCFLFHLFVHQIFSPLQWEENGLISCKHAIVSTIHTPLCWLGWGLWKCWEYLSIPIYLYAYRQYSTHLNTITITSIHMYISVLYLSNSIPTSTILEYHIYIITYIYILCIMIYNHHWYHWYHQQP